MSVGKNRTAYGNTIGNLLVVVAGNLGGIDHVLANELHSGVANRRRAVKEMTLNSPTNIGLFTTILHAQRFI